jgi:hypothetical protein
MPTIINQKNGKVVIHTTANVNSNVSSFQLSDETVTGLNINLVMWGSSNNVQVSRGSNTLLYLNGTGEFDFAGEGVSLQSDSSANVVITVNGTGFCILELNKVPR